MKIKLRLIALLVLTGLGVMLGIAPDDGFHQGWLALAVIAGFAASEARLWKTS